MTNTPTNLRFARRPAPVLPEHRPLYKIAQIVLTLHLASRAAKSSLARLHLFNWAFKKSDRAERLSQAARTKILNVAAWGFDPALVIALRYSCAEGLTTTTGGAYELTDLGRIFANSIIDQPDTLAEERKLLKSTGKNITEAMVDAVARGWYKK